MTASLTEADLAGVDARLAATDRMLAVAYPGEDGSRQPVHTVYVPADRYDTGLPLRWGSGALEAIADVGGVAGLCELVGLETALAGEVAPLVEAKLRSEPIEDLRLDFEDGYGVRSDAEEDGTAVRAAELVAAAVGAGEAPPFVGIRFKCFEAPTRRRGLATLDRFVSTLAGFGRLPDGLVLTLPKVTTVAQVKAMVDVCERLEDALGLPLGRLRFEVQMETPQLILSKNGRVPVARALHEAEGRVSALHYGTYDYSAALQISAEYQSMEHPAADYAKEVMQVAAAETGVRLSDGSTNVIPVGDAEHRAHAWRLHSRLVTRSLERGYYQGWDLHPAQLPTRFIATYAFYRRGLPAAVTRLHDYLTDTGEGVMDEPATARALARFVVRGVQCGAVTASELEAGGLRPGTLLRLAHPKLKSSEESS